ncbi:hypothetical protein [Bacillus pumilus]|uniref:hypothetical protein n=1 Tax=Bacillus pumilus TaxID=1408 RepID=UPI002FFDAD41
MNETRDILPFGQIRDVPLYLSRFGKNMHNANIYEQTAFKEEIKKHLDDTQIKMLLNRLEDGIDNHKASSHFTSAFFVILSFTLGNMLNYGLNLVKVVDDAAAIFIIIFYPVFAAWGLLSYTHSKKLKQANRYITLLQECIDEISEMKSKRRFPKLTNKYRIS